MKKYLSQIFYYLTLERYPNLFRPSSKPYISGDTFRNFSNHIFDETKSLNPYSVKKNDVVFLSSELIEIYFQIFHPKINNKYILITHNSDRSIDSTLTKLSDDKIIHWFAQNLVEESNSKISILPIGLENKRWLKHGKSKWFISKNYAKNKYILSSFNIFNNFEERSKIKDSLNKKELINSHNYKNLDEYFNNLGNYKFVICPNGNGPDTHRIWESLILKTYPVLKINKFTNNLKKLGIPGIYLDEWSEIDAYNEKDLDEIYKSLREADKGLFCDYNYWIKNIRGKFIN